MSSSLSARWRLASDLRAEVSAPLLFWLRDAQSLTQHLKALSQGRFAVQVLTHGHARPTREERALLGLAEHEFALVRQVKLLCQGQAMVFARTVIPLTTLSGKYRLLARLGTRPLGELLFADKTMRREAVEVATLSVDHPMLRGKVNADAGDAITLWGRRSLFYLAEKPLLVSEFFLPAVLNYGVPATGE